MAEEAGGSGNNTKYSSVFPPKKILVAIDGSENAQRAANVAIGLAKDYDARLMIVHVMSVPSSVVSEPGGLRTLEEESDKVLQNVESLAKGHKVNATKETLRTSKSVVQAIIQNAETEKADLIVIGTRGLGGFKKLVLGSVSSGVVSHAHCSVLVVR